MKSIILALALFISTSGIAQLEFIGSFDALARLIYLSDDEPAIMLYYPTNELIELYDTDLTLIESIDIPVEYVGSGQYNLFHPSRTLFDCDSTNIEYLISYGSINDSEAYVKIIRDDGTVIFDLPGHIFTDDSNVSSNPSINASMVEDGEGVVFAFLNEGIPGNGPTSLYRSCGSIPWCSKPCGGDDVSVGEGELSGSINEFILYPNPGRDQFAIEYELSREHSQARLSLVNMSGQVVLQRNVGPSMKYILVNTSNLANGRYQVVLESEDKVLLSTSYVELD